MATLIRQNRFYEKKVLLATKRYIIMINVSVDHVDINIYKPNNRAPKYMKQKLAELKGEIEK